MRVNNPTDRISSIAIDQDIAMGSHKLTGLSAGSDNGHSVRYEQVVGVYLPRAGGTMTGDIAMGSKGIKTTCYYLREETGYGLVIRNAADTDYANLALSNLYLKSVSSYLVHATINAGDYDNATLAFNARDNGVGAVEVAKLVGAADPYFQATLPMRLYPSSAPGTLVEGHFWYDNTAKTIKFRDASATKTLYPTEHAAGDVLWQYIDTELTFSLLGDYTRAREIQVGFGGTLRIKFDILSGDGTPVYGRIYKNGVAVGTEQSTTSTTYVTKSEDISGFEANDKIQLYIRGGASSGNKIRNFRFYTAVKFGFAYATYTLSY